MGRHAVGLLATLVVVALVLVVSQQRPHKAASPAASELHVEEEESMNPRSPRNLASAPAAGAQDEPEGASREAQQQQQQERTDNTLLPSAASSSSSSLPPSLLTMKRAQSQMRLLQGLAAMEPPPDGKKVTVPVQLFVYGDFVGRKEREVCSGTLQAPEGYGFPAGSTWCRVDDPSGSTVVHWKGVWDSAYFSLHNMGEDASIPEPPPTAQVISPRTPAMLVPDRTFKRLPVPAASYILQVRDAFVYSEFGTVFTEKSVYTDYRWMRKLPPPGAQVKLVSVPNPLLSVLMLWGDTFQHVMLDTLPRLSIALDLLRKRPEVVVVHDGGVIESILQALGIPNTRSFTSKPDTVYTSAEVLFPSFAMQIAIGILPLGAYDAAREAIMGPPLTTGERNLILYLGRPSARSRGLEVGVEQDLLSSIRKDLRHGLKLVEVPFSENPNWQEDKELFRRARVILGPHGGAFANMAFSAPGTHVIEFIPRAAIEHPGSFRNLKSTVRPCYMGMAYAARHVYWHVEPKNFSFDTPGMSVNVVEVLDILRFVNVLYTRD